MLLVKTKLGESKIHGIGLFADQFIPTGSVIFQEEEFFTKKITRDEFEKLTELQKDFLMHYSYRYEKLLKLSLDNDRFMNHSNDPNTDDSDPLKTVATRDIQPGEEITCNYNFFI
jgi:SET domain-containing protein